MKTMFAALAIVACLLSVACQGSDLSRTKAKTLLEANGAWTTVMSGREVAAKEVNKVSFTYNQWEPITIFWRDSKTNTASYMASSSECGTGYLACENPAGQPDNVDDRMRMAQYGGLGGVKGVVVTLKTPVKLVVIEVTGISEAQNHFGGSEGPNVKAVEYTWRYDFPKGFLPDGLLLPHEGKAIIQRFDDGWRFVKFMRWGAAANPTGWSL